MESETKIELVAEFVGEDGSNAIGYPVGLFLIDEIRERTEMQDIVGSDNIRFMSIGEWKVRVVVPETFVRDRGIFEYIGTVRVEVPAFSMNRFVVIDSIKDLERDEEHDLIFPMIVRLKPDPDAILCAWRDAGFPLKWNPEHSHRW